MITETMTLLSGAAERSGDHGRISSALVSLGAAQHHLDHMITAEDCVSFVDAWQDDLEEWQRFSSGVNNVESTRDAMDFLQLTTWTRAEFGGVQRIQRIGLAQQCHVALISSRSWRSNCPKAGKYCRSPVDSKPSTW